MLSSSYVDETHFKLLGLASTANIFLSFIYWCYILFNLDRNRRTTVLSVILLLPVTPANCKAYKGSLHIFVINVSFPSLVYYNTLEYTKTTYVKWEEAWRWCIFFLCILAWLEIVLRLCVLSAFSFHWDFPVFIVSPSHHIALLLDVHQKTKASFISHILYCLHYFLLS
jgi:hypothetical protein